VSSPAILVALLALPALMLAAVAGFLVYVLIKYTPVISKIFEMKPILLPTRVPPEPGGEDVRFRTADGIELAGIHFARRAGNRAGMVVFCHEFLSDRWSYQPFVDGLRDSGFDVFTFDFRNHGDSATDPTYRPIQWVSDREVIDLRAALDYLRTRPNHDPAGVGLFGISRGGGAALCLAADDPTVWGIVTDGAFPTHSTIVAYMYRWAEIYVSSGKFYHSLPRVFYDFVGWAGRVRSERRRGSRFVNIERAVERLAPRPWLMIHGEKDTYITVEIARALFDRAGGGKELWIVPKAKHNRCREVAPGEYTAKVADFFRRNSPRQVLAESGGSDAGGAPAPLGVKGATNRSDEVTAAAPLSSIRGL
jgi:pimeloyl-ACP methyl ester carboxylesterase